MLLEALRLALAIGLLIVAPGILLIRAIFPGGRAIHGAGRLAMILGGGMSILMIVGSILGLLPHGERGWFQMIAMGGMPFVETAMLLVCALLFWIGLQRGAYPSIAAGRTLTHSRAGDVSDAKVTFSQGTQQEP